MISPILPTKPTPPNYDKIIEEELSKIDDSTLSHKLRSRFLRKGFYSPYKNPAYNDARVEAFEASVVARMTAEYNNYCLELNAYEIKLREFVSQIDSQIKQSENQIVDWRSEFNLAQTFYNNFQDLVSKKMGFITDVIKGILKIKESEEEEKDES